MSIILRQWKRAVQHGLDLLFPPRCEVCKRSGSVLCPHCLALICPMPTPCCPHCSAPLVESGMCRECSYRPLLLSGLRTVSNYQEPLRSCIHAFKYRGTTRLAEPLGGLLARTYATYSLQADLIMPVPLHSERQKQRGYNQAQLLAEECASQLGISLSTDALIRTRATPAQTHLTMRERLKNVEGAFRLGSAKASETIRGRRIVIVDDVSTTGATLEACAAPLFGAGAKEVWGLVLARPL